MHWTCESKTQEESLQLNTWMEVSAPEQLSRSHASLDETLLNNNPVECIEKHTFPQHTGGKYTNEAEEQISQKCSLRRLKVEFLKLHNNRLMKRNIPLQSTANWPVNTALNLYFLVKYVKQRQQGYGTLQLRRILNGIRLYKNLHGPEW